MNARSSPRACAQTLAASMAFLVGTTVLSGQQPVTLEAAVAPPPETAVAADSGVYTLGDSLDVEQGRTPLTESFDLDSRRWRLEKRRDAIKDTQFKINFRTFYFDRDKLDGSESESFAIGGSAGIKTGYFLDHISFGATGYTSQHLYGDEDKDGALLLEPGQEGYTVLGELYADIRIVDDLNLYVGRKEFDTPFINRNDVRMTPNTFEAITLQGRLKLKEEASIKYGLGYFDAIKERNSDEFVSMAEDAGADVDRGVFTAGALYQKGDFSIGAIDYYCPDIINIGYAEAKMAFPINEDWKPRLAIQFTDQRSVGDELLQDDGFSAQQYGIKAELPVGPALFSAAYTHTTDGANMQSPWSGYPGYTSVQVEDFNRAGEGAIMLRAAYEFTAVDGLSAYALWVHGTDPDVSGQYAKDEYDMNLQWAPSKGVLKGLSLRLRYAIVEQRGGDADTLNDIRVICNYTLTF
jgi:hypothetical protein